MRAFARLPFVSSDGDEARALAIGQLEIAPSGDDLALLAVEAEPGLSRARLRELLVAAELHPAWVSGARQPGAASALYLVEVDGFVADGDRRLPALQKSAGGEVLRVVALGGYARPMSRG